MTLMCLAGPFVRVRSSVMHSLIAQRTAPREHA
jgi:hypothetical protein